MVVSSAPRTVHVCPCTIYMNECVGICQGNECVGEEGGRGGMVDPEETVESSFFTICTLELISLHLSTSNMIFYSPLPFFPLLPSSIPLVLFTFTKTSNCHSFSQIVPPFAPSGNYVNVGIWRARHAILTTMTLNHMRSNVWNLFGFNTTDGKKL